MPFSEISHDQKANKSLEFKGSLFTLTVLHLFNTDLNILTTELARHVQKTPNFFKNMPVVLDLKKISDSDLPLDFIELQHQLKSHGIILVGIRHGNDTQNLAATSIGLPLLSSQNQTNHKKNHSTQPLPDSHSGTLLISTPVRSGQQVYAKNASLVILSTVSHGAEILSDGHIHVYGALRGRALAGIKGDTNCRIFCQHLDAELISIAGHYKLHDDLPTIQTPMTQVYLENEKICVAGI